MNLANKITGNNDQRVYLQSQVNLLEDEHAVFINCIHQANLALTLIIIIKISFTVLTKLQVIIRMSEGVLA